MGPLAFMLIGGLLFVLGAISLRRERAFEREAVGAQGIVVGFQRRAGSKGYLNHPIVRFLTREGQELLFESPVGTSLPLYAEGQLVQVLYHPANPVDARLASGCMRFGLPVAFLILGAGFLLISTCSGLLALLVIV
jgi:hypothetical protein